MLCCAAVYASTLTDRIIALDKFVVVVILVGIETGDETVARTLGKTLVRSRTHEILAEAQRLGIRTCGHFLLGSPDETRAQIDQTIAIAERPGNRRADGYRNILQNPHVGLLFMIPGRGDTLRVYCNRELITQREFKARELKDMKFGLLARNIRFVVSSLSITG